MKRWIQHALRKHKEGALHRQLGISEDKVIPTHVLTEIIDTPIGQHWRSIKVTRLLKQRAVLAKNLRKTK